MLVGLMGAISLCFQPRRITILWLTFQWQGSPCLVAKHLTSVLGPCRSARSVRESSCTDGCLATGRAPPPTPAFTQEQAHEDYFSYFRACVFGVCRHR